MHERACKQVSDFDSRDTPDSDGEHLSARDSDDDKMEQDSDAEEDKGVEVKEYSPLQHVRPLLMCRKQREATSAVADVLELLGPDEFIHLKDAFGNCSHCGEVFQDKSAQTKRRLAFLFTLSHGIRRAIVHDRTCCACRQEILYTGVSDAIFPSSKESL